MSHLLLGTPDWTECLALSNTTTVKYALSDEQRSYLFRFCCGVPAGGTVVELGVCNGVSSIVMAYVAKHVGYKYYGVDNFVLTDSIGPVAYHELMKRLDLPYTLYQATTLEAPIPGPIDLLLIDASHTDPYVSQDCARWVPHVKPSGIAMFHDYDGAPEPISAHWPVRCAVERETSMWMMLYYIDGLMIRQRPTAIAYDVNLAPNVPLASGRTIQINSDGFWRVEGHLDDSSWLITRIDMNPTGPMVSSNYPYKLWYKDGWKMQKVYEHGLGPA